MVKPDGFVRGLVGEIIRRFENKGLKLIALELREFDPKSAELFYEEHKGKDFFDSLVDLIISGPAVGMVWEGPNAVKIVRTLIGATNPAEALPGSIRGDYGLELPANIVHASDSCQSFKRESKIFFGREF
jgi:nucleoside-diphosphate kinase